MIERVLRICTILVANSALVILTSGGTLPNAFESSADFPSRPEVELIATGYANAPPFIANLEIPLVISVAESVPLRSCVLSVSSSSFHISEKRRTVPHQAASRTRRLDLHYQENVARAARFACCSSRSHPFSSRIPPS